MFLILVVKSVRQGTCRRQRLWGCRWLQTTTSGRNKREGNLSRTRKTMQATQRGCADETISGSCTIMVSPFILTSMLHGVCFGAAAGLCELLITISWRHLHIFSHIIMTSAYRTILPRHCFRSRISTVLIIFAMESLVSLMICECIL